MHPKFAQATELTGTVIAAAIEVHRALGPGLLESIYEWALVQEVELRGLRASSEQRVRIEYKGFVREEPLRYDILIDECLLVEVKAVEAIHPIHKAQLLSYMRLLDVPLGLILNFHQDKLVDGVSRLILPHANR
jgi:GxxExxY protein